MILSKLICAHTTTTINKENFLDITIRKEKYLINNEIGLILDYSENQCYAAHSHDFFELFLLISGKITHQLNNETQFLSKGHIILVKPGDVHSINRYKKNSFAIMNFLISKKTYHHLTTFLFSNASPFNQSIVGKITDTNKISDYYSEFLKITKIPSYKKQEINLLSKQLLSNILISLNLHNAHISTHSAPLWFDDLLIEMNKKENYTCGVPRMVEISKKSPEYISRLFKKYLNITPTEHINSVKLHHARVLLTNTNMTILDICYDCGFNSLSNFYKAFETLYGFSPGYFRKDISAHKKS